MAQPRSSPVGAESPLLLLERGWRLSREVRASAHPSLSVSLSVNRSLLDNPLGIALRRSLSWSLPYLALSSQANIAR